MAYEHLDKARANTRGRYPTLVETTVPYLRDLTRAHIKVAGYTIEQLPSVVGSSSRTTLANRIREGRLTQKDMMWLHKSGVVIDWTAIITQAAKLSEEGLTTEDQEKIREEALDPDTIQATAADEEAFINLFKQEN